MKKVTKKKPKDKKSNKKQPKPLNFEIAQECNEEKEENLEQSHQE